MVQEFLKFIFFEKIWNRLSITPRIIGNSLPQNFVIVLPGSKKIPLLPLFNGYDNMRSSILLKLK